MEPHGLMRIGGIAAVTGRAGVLLGDMLGLLIRDFGAAFSGVASTGSWRGFLLCTWLGWLSCCAA